MTLSMQTGIHGRARRHIVAMGGLFAERFTPRNSDVLVSQDEFLALLLRKGAIKAEQLRQAIDSYRRNPQDYAWMLRFEQTTLDKADHVFFVRHGRLPTENSDFVINGDYYQISRTLQYAPDSFDDELRKLTWDAEGKPRIVEGLPKALPKVLTKVQQVTSKKGNAIAFIFILLLEVAGVIALLLLITRLPTAEVLAAALATGISWIVLLSCGLIAARPRQFTTSIVHHLCSECRSRLDLARLASHCPNCGVRLAKQSG